MAWIGSQVRRLRVPGSGFAGSGLFLLSLVGDAEAATPQTLAVAPSSLDFGAGATDRVFEVWRKKGNGTVGYGISVDYEGGPAGWLSLDSTGGTTTGERDPVAVAVDRSGLAPGSYSADVVVTGGTKTRRVGVSVDVVGVALGASAHDFGSSGAPFAFQVWNAGPGTLHFEVHAPAWLTVTGGTGTSHGPSNRRTVVLTPAPGSLSPGNYDDEVLVMPAVPQGLNGAHLDVSLLVPPGGPGGGGSPANQDSPLGVNLNGVVDWSPEMVWTDVFKHSRPFSETGNVPLNAEGYPSSLAPGQMAWTLMCREIQGHYPGGEYHCFYDGAGTITFQYDATVVSQTPGHIVLDVNPSDEGIGLQINATNPANPIRNIRVVMPGFQSNYATQVFHPEFLARWAQAKVIRFMDWQHTNNSTQVNWSDRALPNLQSQATSKGVALEHMIALANALQADPWFCMPHGATDAYVTQFATMVHDNLDPNLTVYVEYSNEVWNSMFQQGSYCEQQGLNLGVSSNPYEARLRYYSQRAVQVFNLWSNVYGPNSNLVRVLGSQNANPWTGTTIMDWQNASASADALAVAPYFGDQLGTPGSCSQTGALSVAGVLAACAADLPAVLGNAQTNATEAGNRGLDLVGYEGGQHLAGVGGCETNGSVNWLFDEANRSPGMYAIYMDYLDQWRNVGGKTMVLFASMSRFTQWGRWGLFEWSDQDPATAPKYAAFGDFIQQNPIWW